MIEGEGRVATERERERETTEERTYGGRAAGRVCE